MTAPVAAAVLTPAVLRALLAGLLVVLSATLAAGTALAQPEQPPAEQSPAPAAEDGQDEQTEDGQAGDGQAGDGQAEDGQAEDGQTQLDDADFGETDLEEGEAEEGWIIESFLTTIDVDPEGAIDVTEEIVVDFGDLERRGIDRVIPVRYEIPPGTPVELPEGREREDFLRRIDVSDIEVESSAADDLEIERPGPVRGTDLRLRIGDEQEPVSGRQLYRISYEVTGAFTERDEHVELYWNATGNNWSVPVVQAETLVRGPQPAVHTCFRGEQTARTFCDDLSATPEATRYTVEELVPGEGMTVVFGYSPEVVETNPPLLVERFTVERALMGNPLTLPATALTSALALLGIAGLLYRQGRDRFRRGGTGVDGRVDPVRKPRLRRRRAVRVQFLPPGGLRPAQLGLVVDERVAPVGVSATVVDLAVRGHLAITETTENGHPVDGHPEGGHPEGGHPEGGHPEGGHPEGNHPEGNHPEGNHPWGSRTDWRLSRTPEAPDELIPYEQRLLDGLFRDGDEVLVSDLKGTFAGDYVAVRDLIYRDGVQRGWFANRPDRRRDRWFFIGVFVTLLAAGLLAAAVLNSTIALAFVPFVVAGVILIVWHRVLPHRTVRGSNVLRRALGFREFISSAESGRMGYAEEPPLFVAYLPYAVVFGSVDRWSRAFAGVGPAGAAAVSSWYLAPGLLDGAPTSAMARASGSISELSCALSASLPAVPATSGGRVSSRERRRRQAGEAKVTAR